MSTFNIPRDQQKLFIEHFIQQVLDLSLQLVDQGKERASPGETIHVVSRAVIAQIQGVSAGNEATDV